MDLWVRLSSVERSALLIMGVLNPPKRARKNRGTPDVPPGLLKSPEPSDQRDKNPKPDGECWRLRP